MYHQSPPATFSHQIMNKITFLVFLKTLITISISSSSSHHNHNHNVHRQYIIIIITGPPNLCLIWPVSLLLRNSSETGESSGVCRETINKIINNFIWFSRPALTKPEAFEKNTNLIRTRTRMLIRPHQFPTQCVVAAWTLDKGLECWCRKAGCICSVSMHCIWRQLTITVLMHKNWMQLLCRCTIEIHDALGLALVGHRSVDAENLGIWLGSFDWRQNWERCSRVFVNGVIKCWCRKDGCNCTVESEDALYLAFVNHLSVARCN